MQKLQRSITKKFYVVRNKITKKFLSTKGKWSSSILEAHICETKAYIKSSLHNIKINTIDIVPVTKNTLYYYSTGRKSQLKSKQTTFPFCICGHSDLHHQPDCKHSFCNCRKFKLKCA